MIKFILESHYLSINLILPVFFALLRMRRELKMTTKLFEYLSLMLFFLTPSLPLALNLKVNLSVTALGGYIACLVYPMIESQLNENTLRQKRRALKKLPLLFMVIFFTMSNHVEMIYIFPFAALIILFLKRNLAGVFFSWPLLLSGFLESSAIINIITIISFALAIYLFEEKNVQEH
ncbi:putative membrane protein [Halobacteriovorax marinus SJ]|uniref:Membrane protein n=2 Tax=Halobacteriovorax marinus TaxID=97084 RepID=E1X391_HALMS|nr:putative membrane protein [Halobacteriovorax marinus SJ]